MLSDDFMLTAEERRLRAQKRQRLLLWLATIVVLGIALAFCARPIAHAIKAFQARRHAARAFAFIDQEKWSDARSEAVAAYQLSGNEPQALRALARFLSRTRQPQALEFWEKLAERAPLSRDDLRDETSAALALGELNRAGKTADILLANNGKEATARDWLLAAQTQLQQGAADKALDSLGKMFARADATPREQFQASLLQLQAAHTADENRNAAQRAEAFARLGRLAQGTDAAALDALVLLAQTQLARQKAADNDPKAEPQSRSSKLPADELVRRLNSHPLAKAPQKLLAIDLEIQARPNERNDLIGRAVSDLQKSEPTELAVLATWLNSKGEFQRELDVVPLEGALQSRELFLQHLDALGALGRWDEIQHLLEAERYPLDPVIQRMYLARANAQLGREAAAKNNWQRALEAATNDAGKLMTLADYAEKNGASAIAATAYTRATAAAPELRAAWQGRLRTTYATRETKRIHAVLAEMLQFWPNDTAIQNDEAYLRLLLLSEKHEPIAEAGGQKSEVSEQKSEGSSVAASTKNQQPITNIKVSQGETLISIEHLAEGLVQREPTSLPHRTLLALDLLLQHRPVAALDVYRGINVVPAALTPSALAVHAAILNANGQHDDARKEIKQTPADNLLPEEQQGTANLRAEGPNEPTSP